MAVVLEQKSLSKYLEGFQSKIAAKTNINLFDKDSKTKALSDVFSEQLYSDRQDVVNAFNSLQLSQAKGNALNQIGLSRGVQRLRETFASVNESELNLSFYVSEGTFGDLNSGSSFTIPKGTKVWSDAKQNDLGKSIFYTLTSDVSCLGTESIAYASARADASGSDFNVGSSVLRNHDFSSYSARSGLLVLNFYSILNGRNEESDDQYRFRISQQYANVATSNETKARLTALNVPGVIDTKTIPGYYGIGTVGLVILGSEYQTTTKMLESVQRNLDSIALPGVKVFALPAVSALFDFELSLKTTKTLSSVEELKIKNTIRRVCVSYLRSRGLGGTVSLSELATMCSQYVSGSILFQRSNTEIFDHVFIRRNFVSSTASERETLSTVYYTLESDEFADLGTLTINYE